MTDPVEMMVDSIRVHMPTGQHVVILKEKDAERYLPIWIGIHEANAIALKITGITPERPITHDLLANMLGAFEVAVKRVVVTNLNNEVFYARIIATMNGRNVEVDSRPSDAIAVAVRVGAQIFVDGDVLEKAGVLPEGEAGGAEDTDERRTKVADWINSMDLPDLGPEGTEGPGTTSES
jgi:bifunctional DNase/RNase